MKKRRTKEIDNDKMDRERESVKDCEKNILTETHPPSVLREEEKDKERETKRRERQRGERETKRGRARKREIAKVIKCGSKQEPTYQEETYYKN